MYTLYNPNTEQYAAVHPTYDCDNLIEEELVGVKEVNNDTALLLVGSYDKLTSLLNITRTMYNPQTKPAFGHYVGDYMCRIEDIHDYEVVKIGKV